MRVTVHVLWVALASVVPLAAQDPEMATFTMEVRLGYGEPTAPLGRTDVLGGSGYVAFGEPTGAGVLGAGVVTRLRGPFHVRVRTEYGSRSEARGQWFCDAFSPCAAVLIPVDGRITRWAVGGDVHYRPSRPRWPVEPRAFLGVARRWYRVRWASVLPEVPIPTEFDTANGTIHAGLGAARRLGRFRLFIEAEVQYGSFGQERPSFIEGVRPPDRLGSPERQVDLALTLGASIGIS